MLEEEELPGGVPLVSHPLWLVLAEAFQYELVFRTPAQKRKHINLLELDAVFQLERELAAGHDCVRYVLGADSQVALAALLKGRSSSPKINAALRRSLPLVILGSLYGNYGFVPSLANPGDDPTRGVELREPKRSRPGWLVDALRGDFSSLDSWLISVGFDPVQVAELPFADRDLFSFSRFSAEVLAPLEEVQKPERLAAFLRKAEEEQCLGAPKFLEVQESTRGQQEPLGQTKNLKKRPENSEEEPKHNFVASEAVAPPQTKPSSKQGSGTGPCRPPQVRRARGLRPSQFLRPGGTRSSEPVSFEKQGYLDLYSGKGGVAKFLCKRYDVWALTFDYAHDTSQNLLLSTVQHRILRLIRSGCFFAIGMAPECASFSRAVTPAVRTYDCPWGLEDISENMQKKVAIGNLHADFVLRVAMLCKRLHLPYWIENSDGLSFGYYPVSWQLALVELKPAIDATNAVLVHHGGRGRDWLLVFLL